MSRSEGLLYKRRLLLSRLGGGDANGGGSGKAPAAQRAALVDRQRGTKLRMLLS